MPTVKVKSAAESARKWVDNASRASGEYADKAMAAASDWATGAGAAGPNYKAAISASDIDKRFSGGIQRAGAAKYSRGVETKGRGRYSGGITAGEQDYSSNVQPYLQAIASTDIPPRKVRGDAGNFDRSKRIGEALNKARLARSGAGR